MIWAAAMDLGAAATDDEVTRLKRGDREVLAAMITRYQHRLYRYLLRFVGQPSIAEDLFQQTWLRVVEHIRRYDTRRSFEPWLFSVAHNLAMDYLRRREPQSLEETEPATILAGEESVLDQMLDFEQSRFIAEAIRELPAIHREVLTLRFEEGMKLEAIAEVARIPLSTVKSRLSRALDALRGRLEDKFRRGGWR